LKYTDETGQKKIKALIRSAKWLQHHNESEVMPVPGIPVPEWWYDDDEAFETSRDALNAIKR